MSDRCFWPPLPVASLCRCIRSWDLFSPTPVCCGTETRPWGLEFLVVCRHFYTVSQVSKRGLPSQDFHIATLAPQHSQSLLDRGAVPSSSSTAGSAVVLEEASQSQGCGIGSQDCETCAPGMPPGVSCRSGHQALRVVALFLRSGHPLSSCDTLRQ